MKATFDGATILNIEYSAKEIKPHFCRATREMEYDCYFDGRYVGTANSHGEAAAKLDELAFEALTHTNACVGFGCVDGCGDCQSEPDMDFSNDFPTVNAQLRKEGLRKARSYEAGWYVNIVEFGHHTKVWATDAAEPVAREWRESRCSFSSYADAKAR